ncbi:MAG TPA: M28 family peptidase [Candidatus Xenobia bacterium]
MQTRIDDVSVDELRATVEALAVPRHHSADVNLRIGNHLAQTLTDLGYHVEVRGQYRTVLAVTETARTQPAVLAGAHYDSVPGTPGADDNASGVAVLLACARRADRQKPLAFAAFNAEEDGALGSREFVSDRTGIAAAHILEMVGYTSDVQRCPPNLPIRLPERGDFLGLLANWPSRHLLPAVLQAASTYIPDLPVVSLTLPPLLDALPLMQRSDHDPFWKAGIAALLWTDTAEFRNPNYHQPGDTPHTLDYRFMRRVAQVLLAVLSA